MLSFLSNEQVRIGRNGMECDGIGWDRMGWDGIGWDGMGWDGIKKDSMTISLSWTALPINVTYFFKASH